MVGTYTNIACVHFLYISLPVYTYWEKKKIVILFNFPIIFYRSRFNINILKSTDVQIINMYLEKCVSLILLHTHTFRHTLTDPYLQMRGSIVI